jgi:hypothetical protein
MTVDKFIAKLEGFYSDSYGEVGQDTMRQYLGGYEEAELDYILAQILKTYERTKGRIAPGVAECEKCKKAAWDEMKAARSRALALAPPDRLQITEGLMAPEDVAAILGRLASAKTVDGTGEGV